jgi:DNA replication and repair protein RecF
MAQSLPLQALRLRDFRCHASHALEMTHPITFILGPNGIGKTALLEAIYFVGRLRSFRTHLLKELIRLGQSEAGIVVQTDTELLRVDQQSNQRLLQINQEMVELQEFWGRLRVMACTSEDRELICGPSENLRRFIDALAAHDVRSLLRGHARYRTVLKQRNALLNGSAPWNAGVFQALTEQLRSVGQPLQEIRAQSTRRMVRLARLFHGKLAPPEERLTLKWSGAGWEADTETERRMGRTLIGFHLDKMEVILGDKPARKFASEGQQRTAALALKLAEAAWLTRRNGQKIVVLADDVVGELDGERRAILGGMLPAMIGKQVQIVASGTDIRWIESLGMDFARHELRRET